MAASNAANCVKAFAARGASALVTGPGCLGLRVARGFVMRLSAIRTQHGYIRPRHRDATGVRLATRLRPRGETWVFSCFPKFSRSLSAPVKLVITVATLPP